MLDHIVGLKYFNVYGPNEYHKGEMRSFILKAFEQIRDKGRVGLFKSYRAEYADGGQLRDFLYVKDAVAMSLFFLDRPDLAGLFNVGTGQARSWNDLAAAVFAAVLAVCDISMSLNKCATRIATACGARISKRPTNQRKLDALEQRYPAGAISLLVYSL